MKNIKNSNSFFLFAATFITVQFFLISCATALPGNSAAAPQWMTNLEAVYPDAKYLAALGSGDSREKAQRSAASSLAQIFNVHIKSDIVTQEKYAELVKEDKRFTADETLFYRTINTYSEEDIINLRYSDPYTDKKGVVHVVAYLERVPTSTIYRSLITKDSEKAQELYDRAATVNNTLSRYAFTMQLIQ
jgi:hypothetical protein